MMPDMCFDSVQDPVLRRKLEAALARHLGRKPVIVPPEADEFPKFVFSRSTNDRRVGAAARVRSQLDEEPRGGTIVKRLGRAFLVDLGDMTVIVHEPDDSWVPFVEAH